jgi:hypothetical protein
MAQMRSISGSKTFPLMGLKRTCLVFARTDANDPNPVISRAEIPQRSEPLT